MSVRLSVSSLATLAFAGLLTGCLEGDPNPLADQDGGSSGISSSGQVPPAPTVQPSGVCSQNSAQAVNLPFRNNFKDRSVRLLWVNYQCTEIDYGALPPGQTAVQQTFISHPWRVRDATSGALYKEVVPTTTAPPEVSVP